MATVCTDTYKIENGILTWVAPKQKELDLSNKGITEIRCAFPSSLRTLYLDSNSIKEIKPNTFNSGLEWLTIEDNILECLQPGAVPDSVFFLSVKCNKLTQFDDGSIPNSVEELYIYGNNLKVETVRKQFPNCGVYARQND